MVQAKEVMVEQPLFEEEAIREVKAEVKPDSIEVKAELNPRYFEEVMTLKQAKIANCAKYGDLHAFNNFY